MDTSDNAKTDHGDSLEEFRLGDVAKSGEFSIPSPPQSDPTKLQKRTTEPTLISAETKSYKWLGKEDHIDVHGFNIGGFVYVGQNLFDPIHQYMSEPSLIDPTLEIGAVGDLTVLQTPYHPSYANISPKFRTAYLTWISTGKSNVEADIGYVFLYFYGLERRLLVDLARDPQAGVERKEILFELHRLLELYAPLSKSFALYCGNLITFIQFRTFEKRTYSKPLPEFINPRQALFHTRLAIGQAALDGVPIPLDLIRQWILHSPHVRSAFVHKHTEIFMIVFDHLFKRKFARGFPIKPCVAKLDLQYKPASKVFGGDTKMRLAFGDIPDMFSVERSFSRIQSLVDQVEEVLAPIKRHLKKSPKLNHLELAFLLPHQLWTIQITMTIANLRDRVTRSMFVTSVKQLGSMFDTNFAFTKPQLLELETALGIHHVLLEPCVTTLQSNLNPSTPIAVFTFDPSDKTENDTRSYSVAELMIETAALISHVGGKFDVVRLHYVNQHIDSLPGLSHQNRARLRAKTRLLIDTPPTMSSISTKLKKIPSSSKTSLGVYVSTFAHHESAPSKEQLQIVEKIYRLLDLNLARMHSDVLQASLPMVAERTGLGFVTLPKAPANRILALDSDKIASLTAESAEVANLLHSIFSENDYNAEEKQMPVVESISTLTQASKYGLDDSNTRFLTTLLTKDQWSRAELEVVSKGLQLMLDGALERINDVGFDYFDMPVTEGDDPIDVNPQFKSAFEL